MVKKRKFTERLEAFLTRQEELQKRIDGILDSWLKIADTMRKAPIIQVLRGTGTPPKLHDGELCMEYKPNGRVALWIGTKDKPALLVDDVLPGPPALGPALGTGRRFTVPMPSPAAVAMARAKAAAAGAKKKAPAGKKP